jgi:GAF domain-containing protein/anti-sigma regulatory factor (Ser/Thr protein kinase)
MGEGQGQGADGGAARGDAAPGGEDPPREPRPDGPRPDRPGPDEPGPPDPQEAAELRQIDWLNRLDTEAEGARDRRDRPPRRERAPGTPTAPDETTPGAEEAPPGPGAAPAGGPAAGPDPRLRDAAVLTAGSALADADSVDAALRAAAQLHAADFPLDGQVVFGITENSLSSLGQYGFRDGGADRSFRMPVSTGYPAVETALTGQAVFLSSPEEFRRRFPATWLLSARKDRHAWAFLPLTAAGRPAGVWLAAFRRPVAFTAAERALLTRTARLVARALERSRTGAAELALSRGLRRSMGTATGAALAGAGLTVATRYVPTGGGLVVGGDWYDTIELPNGRLALVIGDVQGHDVHAAGLMAQLRTAVHAYAAEGHGPDAVLARASRFLGALDPDRFATCIYIEADPGTGTLLIARAGHPHPVLRMPDGTCLVKHIRGGLPLGLITGPDEYEDYPVSELRLQDGEVMLLCTDGLIEAGGHDMFSGWVRVRDALSPGPVADLESVADRLIDAVENVPPPDGRGRPSPGDGDDIALLLIRRDDGAVAPAAPRRRLVTTIEQGQAEALSEARAELRSVLHDWSRPDQVDTAVLLTSELLGNVLVHTDQTAALTATVTGGGRARRLLVEVTDHGDELPHQRAPGELASSGRGLILLDLLSDQWGVRPEPRGKTVWFALDEGSAG